MPQPKNINIIPFEKVLACFGAVCMEIGQLPSAIDVVASVTAKRLAMLAMARDDEYVVVPDIRERMLSFGLVWTVLKPYEAINSKPTDPWAGFPNCMHDSYGGRRSFTFNGIDREIWFDRETSEDLVEALNVGRFARKHGILAEWRAKL